MRRLIQRVFAQRDVEVVAKHAATVFVGQIAVMGFGVVDTIVAGRHAPARSPARAAQAKLAAAADEWEEF